jgi:hypothetical protein
VEKPELKREVVQECSGCGYGPVEATQYSPHNLEDEWLCDVCLRMQRNPALSYVDHADGAVHSFGINVLIERLNYYAHAPQVGEIYSVGTPILFILKGADMHRPFHGTVLGYVQGFDAYHVRSRSGDELWLPRAKVSRLT